MTKTRNATEAVKNVAEMGSRLHTTIAAVKTFFGFNSSSDANPSMEGLQADKSGKGRVDESLFKEALALAKKALVDEKVLTRETANSRGKKITDLFGAQPPNVRKELILDIGIGEQTVTEFIPQGKNSKGEKLPDKKVVTAINRRGINICKDLLMMTPTQIESWFGATVNGTELFKYRLSQIEDQAKKYVTTMEEKHGKLPHRPSLEELDEKAGSGPFSTLFGGLFNSNRREK